MKTGWEGGGGYKTPIGYNFYSFEDWLEKGGGGIED